MAWTDYREISIDHTKLPADTTDLLVDVVGDFPFLATTANGGNVTSANGYDIIFATDNAGASPLYFDRVEWANTGYGCKFKVRIPTASATTDTKFYLLSGNAAITTDQQDRENTLVNYTYAWLNGDLTSHKGSNDLTNTSTTLVSMNKCKGRYIDAANKYLTLSTALACSGAYTLRWRAREYNGGFDSKGKIFSKTGVTNKYIDMYPAMWLEVSTASGVSRFGGMRTTNEQADIAFTTESEYALVQDATTLKLYRNGALYQTLDDNAGSIDIDHIGGFDTAATSFIGWVTNIYYKTGASESLNYLKASWYATAYPHELLTISGPNGAAIVATNNFTNPHALYDLSNFEAGKSPSDLGTAKQSHTADSLTTLNNDEMISSWTDESGTGNTVTQADATKQPSIQLDSTPNGKNTAWFRFLPYLKKLSPTGLPTGNDDRLSICVVLDADYYAYQTIYSYGEAATNKAFSLAFNNNQMFYWGYSNDITVDTNTQGFNSFHIYMTGYTGTNLIHYTDGEITYNQANTLNTGAVSSEVGIFINDYNTYNLWGYLGALHHLNAYPSAGEIADLYSWFALYYGITISGRGSNITRDITVHRAGYAASIKVVAISDTPVYERISTASRDTLTAYVYTDGSQVTNTDCKLYFDGTALDTTFGEPGADGFCLATATITGSESSKKAGLNVYAGKTVYFSGVNASTAESEITGGNITAYSEQEALNSLNSTGEHSLTIQEIANAYNGSPEHSLTFQEVLNVQAGRGQHTMSEQEALFANLQSTLNLEGNATDYSVQELLNLAVINGVTLETVLG